MHSQTANANTPGKRELFEQDPELFQQVGNLVLLEAESSWQKPNRFYHLALMSALVDKREEGIKTGKPW
jgi:hypothetical protein